MDAALGDEHSRACHLNRSMPGLEQDMLVSPLRIGSARKDFPHGEMRAKRSPDTRFKVALQICLAQSFRYRIPST